MGFTFWSLILVACLAGMGLGSLITFYLNRKFGKNTSSTTRSILEDAKQNAAQKIREAELESKEIIYQTKLQMQDEYNRKVNELSQRENKVLSREEQVICHHEDFELKQKDIIKEKGMAQVSDEGELQRFVQEVIKENEKSVQDYKNGKENAIMFLVGQVMKKSKGKANPKIVKEILGKGLVK